jgi:hypothetical protein
VNLQKDDADEKLLAKHDLSPAPYQAPTPHPLPSYEIITHEEVEPETSRGQPLPTPEAVAPAVPANPPESKELENVIEEEESASNDNKDAEVVEKHQDDNDDDSTLSEEEEAAARIQERFSEPLVRCHAHPCGLSHVLVFSDSFTKIFGFVGC